MKSLSDTPSTGQPHNWEGRLCNERSEGHALEVGVVVRDFGEAGGSAPATSKPRVILKASGCPPRMRRPNMATQTLQGESLAESGSVDSVLLLETRRARARLAISFSED